MFFDIMQIFCQADYIYFFDNRTCFSEVEIAWLPYIN